MKKRFLLPISALLSLLLTVFGANAALADARASTAADHIELIELTHKYAWGIDTVDRELLSQVFTKDAKAHYVEVGGKLMGLDEKLDGFEAIYGWIHKNLSHRKGPQGLPWHFMSNHVVEVDGDKAHMKYYMHNRTMAAGGTYYADAVRTSEGWRIANLRLEEQMWKPEAYKNGPEAKRLKGE